MHYGVYGTQKRLIDAYDLLSERVLLVFVCVCLMLFFSLHLSFSVCLSFAKLQIVKKLKKKKTNKQLKEKRFFVQSIQKFIDTTEQTPIHIVEIGNLWFSALYLFSRAELIFPSAELLSSDASLALQIA